jgi:hypothetical protein
MVAPFGIDDHSVLEGNSDFIAGSLRRNIIAA